MVNIFQEFIDKCVWFSIIKRYQFRLNSGTSQNIDTYRFRWNSKQKSNCVIGHNQQKKAMKILFAVFIAIRSDKNPATHNIQSKKLCDDFSVSISERIRSFSQTITVNVYHTTQRIARCLCEKFNLRFFFHDPNLSDY